MQELSEISNRLMDGLMFCRKTYKIFENINEPKMELKKSDYKKEK